jgi:DNA primase
LALDGDEAGVRAGLRSAALAYAAGFDVKVPTFPDGKDPADLARENPELLKAAIRTSKTAVEFFMDTLRHGARDERAYKKTVEAQVLPLIALLTSRIDQEHFVRLVAQKLGVSEAAVQVEMTKRPASEAYHRESEAPEGVAVEVRDTLAPFDKKVGMLFFYFSPESALRTRLVGLLGSERLERLTQDLEPQAEELRFRFESELGDHTTAERIADDMLSDIERVIYKEQIKMKFQG